ncbi:Na+/H+ antiporter subunit D [Neomicrococcus aestuarii]|uniref:Multicomponent Na+:H+ antiporter subunit D n=1 Tax=Neomicrococcus aestuarii TaxID=556325 RepID=A0A1L2ZPH9_9MICC|nr:Na+/H+ antiporter subunit D [Neomicrococcus aestuarii]APF41343.1 Na+/H+ antiporter subunit D [Neomicrococcus aestuarii]MBB5513271.1 multicomponent Na+:H+ antiporter subunit D [Neomicrococcus aestuarii]
MTVQAIAFAPLAVILPLLGAALAFAFRRRRHAQRALTISALTLTLMLEIWLLIGAYQNGAQAVLIANWAPPFGIALVVDEFSGLMLVVSSVVSLAVLLFSTGQGDTDSDQDGPMSIFHPTYLILMAGVSNAFLAGDLFNLYVGFEMLLTASYVLLTMGGTGPRIRAGITYVVVSVISSMLFLLAIAMIYSATGTVNMADLAIKLGELPLETQMMLHIMLLVAFGVKAAVFPLSFWLPDSYPTAPAPVTAVFAGLLTKVGVYAIVRTETLLFPGDSLNTMLMIAALLTMIVGILGAIAQSEIKRVLSFTLTSHIGYMLFGLALGNHQGLAATVYYVAHHIIVQTSLFLVTALIERRAGSSNVDRLGSLAKLSPLLAVLFFIPAINLAGIPPFSGFLGKLGLIQGGVENGSTVAWVLVAGSIITSLLTLHAIARVWNRAFWRKAEEAENPDPLLTTHIPSRREAAQNRSKAREAAVLAAATESPAAAAVNSDVGDEPEITTAQLLPAPMVAPTAALVAIGVALTIFAGPLFAFSDQAAAQMLERAPYIEAVMGGADQVPVEMGGTK